MSKIFIGTLLLFFTTSAYGATYDNIGAGNPPPSNSAQKQINKRIKKSDKINELNTKIYKYEGSQKPADVYDYNRYRQEKNKEIFKRDKP